MLWTLVVSMASRIVSGGKIDGIRFAIIDFPEPGGPMQRIFGPIYHRSGALGSISYSSSTALGLGYVDPLALPQHIEAPPSQSEIGSQPFQRSLVFLVRMAFRSVIRPERLRQPYRPPALGGHPAPAP